MEVPPAAVAAVRRMFRPIKESMITTRGLINSDVRYLTTPVMCMMESVINHGVIFVSDIWKLSHIKVDVVKCVTPEERRLLLGVQVDIETPLGVLVLIPGAQVITSVVSLYIGMTRIDEEHVSQKLAEVKAYINATF